MDGLVLIFDRLNKLLLIWCREGEDFGEKLMGGEGTGEMEGDFEVFVVFVELFDFVVSVFLGRFIFMVEIELDKVA